MARPTTPKLWASDPAAISNEPPLSYRQAGFSAAQPPADYMNWALQNIYQWIDYFDGAGVGGGGGLTITFDSSRPRIQLPFALPADNQLAAIEVFKRETAAVGGISSSVHSASGAVTAGSVTETSTTYGTDPQTIAVGSTSLQFYLRGGDVFQSVSGWGSGARRFDRTQTISISLDWWRSNRNERASRFWQGLHSVLLYINTSNRIFQGSYFNFFWSRNYNDTVSAARKLLNKTYLILAPSQADIAAGNCVVWDFKTGISFRSSLLESSRDLNVHIADNKAPIYENAQNRQLSYGVFASSFNRVEGSSTGSARSSALPALSGSPGYGVASYAYDPAANTVTLVMSGTVSATSFHTFKIKSGTQDRLSLLASNAVFTASAKRFVWSNIAADPIPSAGTYTFEFFESGSGLPVYRFTALTSGLSIEEYEGNYYLYVSSGVANGDVLFIRRRQAA